MCCLGYPRGCFIKLLGSPPALQDNAAEPIHAEELSSKVLLYCPDITIHHQGQADEFFGWVDQIATSSFYKGVNAWQNNSSTLPLGWLCASWRECTGVIFAEFRWNIELKMSQAGRKGRVSDAWACCARTKAAVGWLIVKSNSLLHFLSASWLRSIVSV